MHAWQRTRTGPTSRSSRRAAVFTQHAPLKHATRLIVELARLGTLLTQWWWVCGQTCRRRPREPLWSVVVQVRRLEQQLNLPPICSAFCMRPRRPQRTREACGYLLRSGHAASNARMRYTTQGVHTSLPMDRCCRCVLQPQLNSRIHTGTHAHARTLHRAWSRRMFAPKSRSASANSLMSRSPLPVAITSCSIGTQSYRSDPIDELLDGMVASTLSTLRGPSSNARHLPSVSTWRKYSIRNRSCHYGEYSRVP